MSDNPKDGSFGKVYNSGERTLILKVLTFFANERKYGIKIPLSKVFERTCEATGVSKATLVKLRRLERESKKVGTVKDEAVCERGDVRGPLPFREPRIRARVQEENVIIIKKIIDGFLARKEVPNIDKVLAAVKTESNFPWQRTTLRKILKEKLGCKLNNTIHPIMEKGFELPKSNCKQKNHEEALDISELVEVQMKDDND